MPIVLLFLLLLLFPAPPRSAAASEAEVPGPLANAVSEALIVWALVATTGDSPRLESAFVIGGPQHRLLDTESTDWDATGRLQPFRFTIRELHLRSSGSETATVWASIEATRGGFEPRILSWDFDLIRRGGRWKVWTVLSADRPEAGTAQRFVSPTTSTTSTATVPNEEPPEQKHAAAQPLDLVAPKPGVRLPALSAWIIVITVIGVALAGYLAPRIDRGREQ